MSMSNIRNLVTRQTNDASRSKLPNYVCIEDEVVLVNFILKNIFNVDLILKR
jgi:hypothetical protein